MDLHVLRGARIVPLADGDGSPFAEVLDGNPLGPGWPLPPAATGRVVVWSGWLGAEDEGAPGVRTWGRAGREAFERLCDRLGEAARARGATVLVRPHARHVLSDIPSCADFLRRCAGDGLGLLLDPASMLTPSMLLHGVEHVARVIGGLAPMTGVGAVVLANVERVAPGSDDLRLVALTRGELEAPALAAAAREVPRGLPVVLMDEELVAQIALLSGVLPGRLG